MPVPGQGCMNDVTTEPALIRVSLVCLAYLTDVVSMCVCTIRHRQTSERLVQALNGSTVLSRATASNSSIILNLTIYNDLIVDALCCTYPRYLYVLRL